MITVNSIRHISYFFATFFVGNIFERGIVFSYVLKYFELEIVNSVRNPPSFFATFFVGNILERGIAFLMFARITSLFYPHFLQFVRSAPLPLFFLYMADLRPYGHNWVPCTMGILGR